MRVQFNRHLELLRSFSFLHSQICDWIFLCRFELYPSLTKAVLANTPTRRNLNTTWNFSRNTANRLVEWNVKQNTFTDSVVAGCTINQVHRGFWLDFCDANGKDWT